MKKTYIVFAFLLYTANVFAQQDTTLVYSRPGFEKDALRATLNKTITKKDSVWELNLTDNNKTLYETVTFADEKLEVRRGPYAYYEKAVLIKEGQYNRGYQVGDWKTYYSTKQLKEEVHFVWGKKQGPYRSYWDNGKIKRDGNYENDLRVDEWKLYRKTGEIALIQKYNSAGELVESEFFNQNGDNVQQGPSYTGGLTTFYKFVKKEMNYPREALKQNVKGEVTLVFTVKSDGSISDIKAMESPSPILSKEAIRILSKSSGWIPGTQLNEPVDMRFSLPIVFAIAKAN